MPVEECGNMLIMTAAIAKVEGNANYAKKHWPVLTTWVDYLKKEGFDPETQLCTDDFAGHLARNANLSVKAIMGIASYGYLAGLLGDPKTADEHTALAKSLAQKWMQLAGDGNRYNLCFDRKDTWSQKYNLVWDKLLETDIFPNRYFSEGSGRKRSEILSDATATLRPAVRQPQNLHQVGLDCVDGHLGQQSG